jgi:hypothetical protein
MTWINFMRNIQHRHYDLSKEKMQLIFQTLYRERQFEHISWKKHLTFPIEAQHFYKE